MQLISSELKVIIKQVLDVECLAYSKTSESWISGFIWNCRTPNIQQTSVYNTAFTWYRVFWHIIKKRNNLLDISVFYSFRKQKNDKPPDSACACPACDGMVRELPCGTGGWTKANKTWWQETKGISPSPPLQWYESIPSFMGNGKDPLLFFLLKYDKPSQC